MKLQPQQTICLVTATACSATRDTICKKTVQHRKKFLQPQTQCGQQPRQQQLLTQKLKSMPLPLQSQVQELRYLVQQ